MTKDLILQGLRAKCPVPELTQIIRRSRSGSKTVLYFWAVLDPVLKLVYIFRRMRVWFCNNFAHGSGSWVPGNTQAQHCLLLAIFGYFWLFLAIFAYFGCFWLLLNILDTSGYFWILWLLGATFGYFWLFFFGYFWLLLVTLGFFLASFD